MYQYSISLFVLLAASSVLVAGQEREDANELVDTLVKLVKGKYKQPMKPIEMRNRTIGINERIGLVNVVALVRIKKGFINHIGGIARVGDSFMTEYEDESTLIEMRLGLFDIRFNATIEVEIMGIRQTEIVYGSVEFFGIDFEVMTNFTTGERKIDKVKIFEMSGLKLKLYGPNDIVNRFQNVPLNVGIRVVMNSNLKRIVNAIVSVAVSDSVARIAGGANDKKKTDESEDPFV